MTISRCSLLLGALLAFSGCDGDLYQDASACRDDDANTVCPIDGSRDGPAKSDNEPLNAEYDACVREDRAGCDDEELLRQDKLLNAKYRTVLARLKPEERRALQALERSWFTERDKRCGDEAQRAAEEATAMGPGAAAQAVDTMCRLEATESRVQWLDHYGKQSR